MQTIEDGVLQELDNPTGLTIVHNPKNPTLMLIVDADGKQVHPSYFTSRQKAEQTLYLILSKAEIASKS